MTAKKLLLLSVMLMCQMLCAQEDTIALQEVLIPDRQLRKFSNTQSVITLNDSVIKQNRYQLTSLLNYNSPVYFKENGYGMVSSPSFRGTTAQHTAVIWNGININSQFNGQTDFNTISTTSFEQIDVRAGGGSVIYGTSAIGGTVHLNNNLAFSDHFDTDLFLSHGSFDTQQVRAKVSAGTRTWSFSSAISRNSSDNDFELPNGTRNQNGQFHNTHFSASAGYRFNSRNIIKFYSQTTEGQRHFALLRPTDTKSKYLDFNSRNLLEWESRFDRLVSKVRVAYLNEQYKYYTNIESDRHFYGNVTSFVAKYDFTYTTAKHQFNAVADYTGTSGRGSDIEDRSRSVSALSVLFKNSDAAKLTYELGLRGELTDNYESPLLFSAGAKYRFNNFYSLRTNVSRNFRIPTFNDLYWSQGGNGDLKPESSYQAELGNDFKVKNATLNITAYYMQIDDMIQWLPGQAVIWFPRNVRKVESYGVEAVAKAQKSFEKNHFTFDATYAYTVSENEAGKQLIYVPRHKATGGLSYRRNRISANTQVLYNGAVFFRTDNNPRYVIDGYCVSNLGIGYQLPKVRIGATMHNIFDTEYTVMDGRPFPGRNFTFYLNLNF